MYSILQFAWVAAVILATVGYSDAICRFTDKLKPVDLHFSQYAGKRLQILYGTVNDFSVNLDQAVIDISKIGNSQYFAVNTATLKNGTTDVMNYTIDYTDGVMSETYTDKDEKGKNYQSRSYILGKTDEGALYYYRCSDREYPLDLRFIVIPDGKQLSEESYKKLKAIDGSFEFTGIIFKLPHDLQVA